LCTLLALDAGTNHQERFTDITSSGPQNDPQVRVAKMIVTTTRITVSSANRTELFQTILTLQMAVKNEKGCLGSQFYLDSADTNCAMVVEDWENHLRSRDCAVFLGAVSVLCRPASIDFKLLSYVAGLEAITAVRSIDVRDQS
jgi:hypothetical protein